ncbi:MAG: hypothetical protein HPY70_02320 [Firmicutes bacterium]|nr:hypothetical protein [Bacillota bacterium]
MASIHQIYDSHLGELEKIQDYISKIIGKEIVDIQVGENSNLKLTLNDSSTLNIQLNEKGKMELKIQSIELDALEKSTFHQGVDFNEYY